MLQTKDRCDVRWKKKLFSIRTTNLYRVIPSDSAWERPATAMTQKGVKDDYIHLAEDKHIHTTYKCTHFLIARITSHWNNLLHGGFPTLVTFLLEQNL